MCEIVKCVWCHMTHDQILCLCFYMYMSVGFFFFIILFNLSTSSYGYFYILLFCSRWLWTIWHNHKPAFKSSQSASAYDSTEIQCGQNSIQIQISGYISEWVMSIYSTTTRIGVKNDWFMCYVLMHAAHRIPERNWIERRKLQLNRVTLLLRFVELTVIWFTNTPVNATDPYCMENEHRAFAHLSTWMLWKLFDFCFCFFSFSSTTTNMIRWFGWAKSNTWSVQCHTNWPTDGFKKMNGARFHLNFFRFFSILHQ